jgi:predicted metal-dependent hydrolase
MNPHHDVTDRMTEPTLLHLAGDPALAVHLRRSARARRISLRVSRLDGRITLTLPTGVQQRLGEAFVAERAAWLRAALAGLDRVCPVIPGALLPVEGVPLCVTRAPVRGVQIDGDALLVPERGRPGAVAAAWLKLRARARVLDAVDRYAAALGPAARRPPARLRLADPKGRWGSCSSAGDIMLSWRLILAPPAVLDYVAAHEVAHLAQMNHSPAFWAEVARLMPDHARHRDWLRRNGSALHRYDFSAV